MNFLNREAEIERLDGIMTRVGGFAVVYGRRRLGKSRMLVEWVQRHRGVYTVADQSASEIQRRYFAESLSAVFPGFADVEYRDWRSVLSRLAREAASARWHGPLVLDELPYLVHAAPELPSVMQRWLDREAQSIVVVAAGSSQRMIQGLVLDQDAPLYGRATEIIDLSPLAPRYLYGAFGNLPAVIAVELYAAWGGVPRYWELAAPLAGSVEAKIDRLVLDPLGPLHREPDRLILEELPPAIEVRPVLDAIGAGAHRVSEIAARIGRPATSLNRPLRRLIGMGLVRKEQPFGESERDSKRSLYKISDPFTRLWFRVVAPTRGQLATADSQGRRMLLSRHWPHLVAAAWEDLCRMQVPRLTNALGERFGPASRWWHGHEPEWDVVAMSLDGCRILLGEVKWSAQPYDKIAFDRLQQTLASRPIPNLAGGTQGREVTRVIFLPDAGQLAPQPGIRVITAKDVLEV